MEINLMVSSAYLVRKPASPSELKRFFDQRIIPAAIDGAGCLDMGIANVTRQFRHNPKMGLGLALGALVTISLISRRARRSFGTRRSLKESRPNRLEAAKSKAKVARER